MKRLKKWPITVFLIFIFLQAPLSLRLKGTLEPSETFFFFLAKFGFQKTEILNKDATQGYIYGNITFQGHEGLESEEKVTLAVLDRANFLEYYGNRSVINGQVACQKMFKKINSVAYDANCHDDGEQDFLRSVPCQEGDLCSEEDNPDNVVKGSQFTFRIQDLYQARFWYISIVACKRNASTCQWDNVPDFKGILDYDIHLVNGNPESSLSQNIFKFQFSSDKQDLLQVYLGLLLVYTILLPLQIHATIKQEHPISKLLAFGLGAQFTALLLITLHLSLFAANGYGIPVFSVIGEGLEILSESMFMLLLILLAMGWAITRQDLTYKSTLFGLWLAYTSVSVLMFVWMKTEVDVIEDIEEFQTVPGIITLVMRIIVMVCFVAALRDTMQHEYNCDKLNFFLHFGAASLVWFNYLPLLSLVALQISALWREKFLSGVSYSVDTFAYAILIHLLWPGRNNQYFLLAVRKTDHSEELEELCEAANHVNESGGESGGEFWLITGGGGSGDAQNDKTDNDDIIENNDAKKVHADVTDLVVI